MSRMIKSSTHKLGEALLEQPEAPVRAVTIGRFVIAWTGKEGDYMETVSTDEILGRTTATGAPAAGFVATDSQE